MNPEDSGRDISDNEDTYNNNYNINNTRKNMKEFEQLLKSTIQEEHCIMFESLKKLLSIDILSSLYDQGAYIPIQHICRYLDLKSLYRMELVCKKWVEIMYATNVWRELIRVNLKKDPLWNDIGIARKWLKYVEEDTIANRIDATYFKQLYKNILCDIKMLGKNWACGKFYTESIHCQSVNTNGVYCIQYDCNKIIAGLRDNTAKIWDMETKTMQGEFIGHTGSVLCLQYNDKYLITGSSDSSIRIWNIETRKCIKLLNEHNSAVLNLKFKDKRLITCSKDWLLKVWNFENITNPTLVKTLSSHRGAINAIDFDNKYILSASGDRTLVLWDANTLEFLYTFVGHQRGIASLHYEYPIAATGSSDYSIRLWNVDTRSCIQVVQGNEELVRCIRFNQNLLVSGSYDGKIRIWNLKYLLHFTANYYNNSTCLVLHKHNGRVFKVLFDRLKLVSSSHDDSIIFWNFLEKNYESSCYWDWNPSNKITAITCYENFQIN